MCEGRRSLFHKRHGKIKNRVGSLQITHNSSSLPMLHRSVEGFSLNDLLSFWEGTEYNAFGLARKKLFQVLFTLLLYYTPWNVIEQGAKFFDFEKTGSARLEQASCKFGVCHFTIKLTTHIMFATICFCLRVAIWTKKSQIF